MTRATRPSSGRQRGAALLMAMILVAVVTTLAAGMMWIQWQAVQVEMAERTQVQGEQILQGALDWSRLILREDLRSGGADHLGEPWAVPLSEARLSTFLAADRDNTDDAPDAFLSGAIQDAQARYNLRNLMGKSSSGGPGQGGKGQGQPQGPSVTVIEMRTLQRLCTQVGLSATTANRMAEALTQALSAQETGRDESNPTGSSGDVPLLPADERHLTWLGLDRTSAERLRPFVVLLPKRTPVNINTAPREVLAAMLPDVDLAGIERLIQARQRQPLKDLAAAPSLLGTQQTLDGQRFSINTRYFEVTGALRRGNLVVAQRSLIERENLNSIRVLRSDRIPATELVTSVSMR